MFAYNTGKRQLERSTYGIAFVRILLKVTRYMSRNNNIVSEDGFINLFNGIDQEDRFTKVFAQ